VRRSDEAHAGTEAGLAHELVEAGISPQQIVLGYRIPEIRQHTGFAVV
jgi:XisI protein